MNEQRQLLDALRIDRTADAAARTRSAARRQLVLAVVAALAVGAGAGWLVGANTSSSTNAGPGTSASSSFVANNAGPANGEASDHGPATTPDAAGNPVSTPVPEPVAASGASVLSASGYITARRMATVASRLTGLITEVTVEEGMVVKSGDVLARLDDTLARVDLELARAQRASAEARIRAVTASLQEAQRVQKRLANLKATDFASEAALTQARADVERLGADLASARADAEVARQQAAHQQETLDQHAIRAPFDGVVTDKNAQPGEVVSPMSAGGGFTRTGICTIVDMASLEIEVDVNEAYIARLSEGQKVVANLDAYPDWDIPARLVAIIPTANRDKATVRVRVALEASDPRILPDMGVKVAFLKS